MWPRGTLSHSDAPLCLSGSHSRFEYQRTQMRAIEHSLHSHNFTFNPPQKKNRTFCCTPQLPSLVSPFSAQMLLHRDVFLDHPLSAVTLTLEEHSHLAHLWSYGPSAYLLPKQNPLSLSYSVCLFGIVGSPREGSSGLAHYTTVVSD